MSRIEDRTTGEPVYCEDCDSRLATHYRKTVNGSRATCGCTKPKETK